MILGASIIRALCAPSNPRPLLSPFAEAFKHPSGLSGGLSVAGYDVTVDSDISVPVGGFLLASTRERFVLPLDIGATVCDKSTWARRGLVCQNTWADPGWEGWLTVELTNHGAQAWYLESGTPLCQVVFHRVEGAEAGYAGKYQQQQRGPQKAR